MEMDNSSSAVELRESDELNVTELKVFQESLRNIRDQISTSTSYTIEEAVYGIEALINIRYSEYQADYDTKFFRDSFLFDSNSENYYDLFLKAKSSVESLATENNIVGLNLEEIKNENENRLFHATTITSGGNDPLSTPSPDCENVFYHSMYVGSHSLDVETGEIELNKYDCDIDPECGNIGISNGRLTEPVASSEIGRQLTKRKPKPIEEYCSGKTWKNSPLQHKFIDFKGIGVAGYSFEEMKYLNKCYHSLSGEVTACDCISPVQLNDIYNIFNVQIDDLLDYINLFKFPDHVLTGVLTWGSSDESDGKGNKDSNVRINCAMFIAKPFCLYVDDVQDLLEMDFHN